MDSGRLVFAQLMDFMPRHDFDACVQRYNGDRRLRGFSCRDQFLSTTLKPARTGQISTFQLGQQFRSFGLGSGLSHDLASVHCLTLAFGRACRPIR